MPSHPTPAPTRPTRWRDTPDWGWKPLVTVVVLSLLAILVPRGISAALPDPETSHPPVDVVLQGSGEDAQKLPLKGPDGAQLRCQKSTKGMLQGWECADTKIVVQTVPTPEDVDLAVRRAVRAANTSEVPSEEVQHIGGTPVLRLDPEQARTYAPDLPEGGQIGAYALVDRLGTPGETTLVVVQGQEELVSSVQQSILGSEKGGAR